MDLTQESSQALTDERPLPPNFDCLEDLINIPDERLSKAPVVNIIGLVKDFQPPIQTRGSDWKCTLRILDLSTQFSDRDTVEVAIFWPKDKMPRIQGVGDVVLIRQVKVQRRSGYISLLANFRSQFHIFQAAQIPPWPLKSSRDLPKPSSSTGTGQPTQLEADYIVWMSHSIDKEMLPKAQEFEQRSRQAMNFKDKYSLLKDVKADHFYDLIGDVVRVFESDGRVSLYLSDYTTHTLFYNQVWGGGDNGDLGGRDGDEYGYIRSKPSKASKDWPGPFGKMTIQLTVYGPHAAFIRECVKIGNWLLLKNVQIAMGKQGGCLEGFLREDRNAHEDKVQVEIIKQDDPSLVDPRWKDALRRKKQYVRKFDEEKQKLLEESNNTGKRKAEEEGSSKRNAKVRRTEKRAAAEQKAALTEDKIGLVEDKLAVKLDLNSNIRCNNPEIPTTSVIDILNTTAMLKLDSGLEVKVPFNNFKYRANVRVTDFFPQTLEDFAVGRRITEYDVLSDYSGGESTDNEGDMEQFHAGKGWGGPKKWEWRFALQVEDMSTKKNSRSGTMWLQVGNEAAQMLLNMDAVNLRQDEDTITALRELLFRLWGDLEEKKSAFLKAKSKAKLSSEPKPTPEEPKMVTHWSADDPPPDSDDEEQPQASPRVSKATALAERNANLGPPIALDTNPESTPEDNFSQIPIANRGFTCCIQEYGIEVSEESPKKADAGPGKRWQRMFGLFGTKII